MDATVKITRNRVAMIVLIVVGVVLLSFMVPNLLAPPLPLAAAREYLHENLARGGTGESGQEATRITAVDARRFLFAPPWSSRQVYVVRASVQPPGEPARVRYFTLVRTRGGDLLPGATETSASTWWLAK